MKGPSTSDLVQLTRVNFYWSREVKGRRVIQEMTILDGVRESNPENVDQHLCMLGPWGGLYKMYQRVERTKHSLYWVKTPENRGRTSWPTMPYASPFLCVCTYIYVHFESPQGIILQGLPVKKSDFHLLFIMHLMTPHLKAIIIIYTWSSTTKKGFKNSWEK